MKFTPSEEFLVAARAAGRLITLKVYIKKTASRSELLSAGTWNDVTDYISAKSIGAIKSAVEINLSQYSADKITLTGLGIAFWDTNYFSYANFLELKVEYILNDLVSEPAPVFAGWIEKKKDSFVARRNERTDTVKFAVWSYIDYADEIHASSLLAQYIDDDIDNAGADGLELPHIANLFVTNANIATFVLKKGVHTISYQVTDTPEKQAKLDGGDWVTLSTGTENTLINGDGDQKVVVYARSTIPATGEFADDVIVDVPTDTLPKNWYSSISAQFLSLKLLERAGITTLSLDTLEYPTKDWGKKMSFLDVVPNDISRSKNRDAIESDGTYLWAGVANKLYRREMTTGVYTDKQTMASGANIRKLMYNARNGHLWIFCSNGYLYRYIVASDTLSAYVALTANVHYGTVLIADFSKTSGGYEYGIIYNNFNTAKIRRVDGSTLADTEIGPGTTYYLGGAFFRAGAKYWVQAGNFVETGAGYREWRYNTVDAIWEDYGLQLVLNYSYDAFAYHPGEDRVYYFDAAARTLRSHTCSSATSTFIDTLANIGGNFDNNVRLFYSAADTAVFIATSGKILYRIESNAGPAVGSGVQNKYSTFCNHNGRLYGVDILGRLYHYANVVALYVETADFEGMTVRGAIDKICSSFSLLYKVNSTKAARVQRRSDENGDVVTSGESVSLTSDNMRDVTDDSFYGDAYDIVKVSNGRIEINYDGSVYDAVAFDEEKVLTIDSDWIPDEILEDLAYNLFLFFSVAHKVYLVPSPEALMQYESLDGADIDHNGNMVLNESGVIISDSVDPVGRMEFKVLVNA